MVEQIKITRGTLTESGVDSPYRNRSVPENMKLLRSMRDGAMNDGDCVLRAKIDMRSPNLNMRDPVLYRIKKSVPHPATGTQWW